MRWQGSVAWAFAWGVGPGRQVHAGGGREACLPPPRRRRTTALRLECGKRGRPAAARCCSQGFRGALLLGGGRGETKPGLPGARCQRLRQGSPLQRLAARPRQMCGCQRPPLPPDPSPPPREPLAGAARPRVSAAGVVMATLAALLWRLCHLSPLLPARAGPSTPRPPLPAHRARQFCGGSGRRAGRRARGGACPARSEGDGERAAPGRRRPRPVGGPAARGGAGGVGCGGGALPRLVVRSW